MPESGNYSPETRGLWYSFTAGSVRVVSLNNDDVAFQDAGNSYVHGYSAGEQKRWLTNELADARRDTNVDWLVVCMHQTAISTADKTNGADLGIRQEWLPPFDQYQVDLVVCGHEHHYGTVAPAARGTGQRHPNTHSRRHPQRPHRHHPRNGAPCLSVGAARRFPLNGFFSTPQPRCRVITGVGAFDPALGVKKPIYVVEDALWSAFRDRDHPYGFVAFDVDPGRPAGRQHVNQGNALRRDRPLRRDEHWSRSSP